MGKIIVATPQNPVSYISTSTLFPLVFLSILGRSVYIYIILLLKKEYEFSESFVSSHIPMTATLKKHTEGVGD
jgi:hypothetical protein